MRKDKIVYSINVEDLQAVAKVAYGKKLSNEELIIVSDKVGDYFHDWFDRIDTAIEDTLNLEQLDEYDWDEFPY